MNPREINTDFTKALIAAALKHASRNAPDRLGWISRTADECGMDERTVRGLMYGESGASFTAALKLMAYLGKEFGTQAIEPAGLACVKSSDHELIQSAELLSAIKQLIPVLEGVVEDARETVKLRAVP